MQITRKNRVNQKSIVYFVSSSRSLAAPSFQLPSRRLERNPHWSERRFAVGSLEPWRGLCRPWRRPTSCSSFWWCYRTRKFKLTNEIVKATVISKVRNINFTVKTLHWCISSGRIHYQCKCWTCSWTKRIIKFKLIVFYNFFDFIDA